MTKFPKLAKTVLTPRLPAALVSVSAHVMWSSQMSSNFRTGIPGLCSGEQITKNGSQFSSVAQSCLTLCDPMGCSMLGFPVYHHSQSLLKLMPIESVMPSNHLILCCPLLLPPSVFPSIMVFSHESVLGIRWPKY